MPFTNAQWEEAIVNLSNAGVTASIAAFTDTSATGTVTALNDAVSIALPGGQATVLVQITGTWVGTLLFEGSPDGGTTYYALTGNQAGTSTGATSTTTNSAWRVGVAGFTNFRVRLNPVTSGTATIKLIATQGVHNVFVNNASTLGQQVMSQSQSIVIASDQIPLPVKGNFLEVAGAGIGVVNAINTDLIPSTDVSAYKWLTLQIEGVYVGVLTFQWSNDGVNFRSLLLNRLDVPGYSNGGSSTSATTVGFSGPATFRYFRVRMTAYTSNTSLAGTLELYTQAPSLPLANMQAYQGSTWTQIPNAATTGGSTPFHAISAATTNATSLKSSAGQLYNYNFSNSNAAIRYVKLFNKASAPTVGTDIPIKTIQVPASGNASGQFPVGSAFGLGIAFAITALLADLDTTVVGAGDISFDVDYK